MKPERQVSIPGRILLLRPNNARLPSTDSTSMIACKAADPNKVLIADIRTILYLRQASVPPNCRAQNRRLSPIKPRVLMQNDAVK